MEREEHRLAVVDGVTMRSTLEARWAIFFGCLRLKWEYEPETFELPNGGRYTPDFHVSYLGWVEIKPTVDHLRESWPRIKAFLKTKPADPIWAFCSDKVRLRKNEVVYFKDDQILVPNEAQAYAMLSRARDKRLGTENGRSLYSAGIASAIVTANEAKIDRMISIGDRFKYDAERIIMDGHYR